MLILGIETSCDETGAAIISANKNDARVNLLSNSLATSLALHAKTGGIIPENAAREQIRYVIPTIEDALTQAKIRLVDVDAIAVTYGPGLIGSLLVGVETAKSLSFALNKPLVPTNHLIGHIYANFISQTPSSKFQIQFPALAVIVSGGHTDLVLMQKHGNLKWLGGTRDDAAGEAMDKIGRLLNLPYPGGPYIEKAAAKGTPGKYVFPRPLIGSKDFDFSFSGLKTSVLYEVQKTRLDEEKVNDISLGVQTAIIGVLTKKTMKAAVKFKVRSILLSGGVAANQTLRKEFQQRSGELGIELFVPEKSLCADNGAMIASAAFFNYKEVPWQKVDTDPGLHFD